MLPRHARGAQVAEKANGDLEKVQEQFNKAKEKAAGIVADSQAAADKITFHLRKLFLINVLYPRM